MLNKKGLSDVIATVLIILLALAAIVIVWSFIQPAIEGTGTSVTSSQKCFDIEVRPLSCSGTTVVIQWMKGDIGTSTVPAQVIAVVRAPTGGVVSTSDRAPVSASTRQATATMPGTITEGSKARAQAVITDANNNLVICPESPTEITCT